MRSGKYKHGFGSKWTDVLSNFSKDQLAWVGAVAMAYNEAELALQIAFINSTDYPCNTIDMVTRLGVGQLPRFVLDAVKHYAQGDKAIVKLAEAALMADGFTQLKSYRDGVVHATLTDAATLVGTVPNKGRAEAVLLSEKATEGLFHRLCFIRSEISEITEILSSTRSLRWSDVSDIRHARHKEQLEQSIRVATDRLAQLQKQRKRLPPLPAFPKGSQLISLAPPKTANPLVPTI